MVSRLRSQAAGDTLAKESPGGVDIPFCEPETTTSSPQASVSIGTAPRLETASTASRQERARVSSPIRWMSATVAVEVSECTTTARRSVSSAMAAATVSGWGGRPHSHSSTCTSAPNARAIATQRSPNAPAETHNTRSPGSIRFAKTDSNRTGARGREEQHVVLGAEDELELAQHLSIGRHERRAAVMLLRPAHDGEHLGRHGHGAGREQERGVGRANSSRSSFWAIVGSARPPVAFMT